MQNVGFETFWKLQIHLLTLLTASHVVTVNTRDARNQKFTAKLDHINKCLTIKIQYQAYTLSGHTVAAHHTCRVP
jgi:hypothetical protein